MTNNHTAILEDSGIRETFIIRTEWWGAIQKLDSEAKAQLMDNLFYFHTGEMEKINLNNLSVSLVWLLIEPGLKRNIKAYDRRCETSRINGMLGGRPRKEEEKEEEKPIENLNNLPEPIETLPEPDPEPESDNDRIDYSFFASFWNDSLPDHGKVSALTAKRKKAIKSRLPEFSKTQKEQQETFQVIIEKIKASPFLNGDSDRNWKPDFDWLFKNEDNWRKIYEGKFDSKNQKPSTASTDSNTVTLPDGTVVTLGVGEYMHERGHRTLGQGFNEIPFDAPPRPGDRYYWDKVNNMWQYNAMM